MLLFTDFFIRYRRYSTMDQFKMQCYVSLRTMPNTYLYTVQHTNDYKLKKNHDSTSTFRHVCEIHFDKDNNYMGSISFVFLTNYTI